MVLSRCKNEHPHGHTTLTERMLPSTTYVRCAMCEERRHCQWFCVRSAVVWRSNTFACDDRHLRQFHYVRSQNRQRRCRTHPFWCVCVVAPNSITVCWVCDRKCACASHAYDYDNDDRQHFVIIQLIHRVECRLFNQSSCANRQLISQQNQSRIRVSLNFQNEMQINLLPFIQFKLKNSRVQFRWHFLPYLIFCISAMQCARPEIPLQTQSRRAAKQETNKKCYPKLHRKFAFCPLHAHPIHAHHLSTLTVLLRVYMTIRSQREHIRTSWARL